MNRQMEWYRMYTEARTDAKLRALSDAEHRVWFHLLCFAAEQEGTNRGSIIGYDDELLAVEVSNADAALLRVTLNRLRVLRIITEDEDPETGEKVITFCSFKRRQYDKPSDEPERVKSRVAAYRARNKQGSNADVTRGNAQERRDTDTDTENHSPNGKVNPNVIAADAPAPAEGEPLARTRKHTPRKPVQEPQPRVNPLWDVLVDIFDAPATDTEKSNYGKAVRELKAANATPDEIRRRVANHSGDWDLTINALLKHWTELGRAPNPSRPRQNGRATVPDIPSTIPRLSD